MLKKLLLIFISIFLFLPACAKESEFTYPKIELTEDDKAFLTERLESLWDAGNMDVEDAEGNLKIKSAYWGGSASNHFFLPESMRRMSSGGYQTDIVMIDEAELFPDGKGKHVYLFFEYISGGIDTELTKCTKADLSNGVITLRFENSYDIAQGVPCVVTYYVGVVKIPKSSLSGDIHTLDLKIESVV